MSDVADGNCSLRGRRVLKERYIDITLLMSEQRLASVPKFEGLPPINYAPHSITVRYTLNFFLSIAVVVNPSAGSGRTRADVCRSSTTP
jgi:hypothetical protein